jgi:hypothetical protein
VVGVDPSHIWILGLKNAVAAQTNAVMVWKSNTAITGAFGSQPAFTCAAGPTVIHGETAVGAIVNGEVVVGSSVAGES